MAASFPVLDLGEALVEPTDQSILAIQRDADVDATFRTLAGQLEHLFKGISPNAVSKILYKVHALNERAANAGNSLGTNARKRFLALCLIAGGLQRTNLSVEMAKPDYGEAAALVRAYFMVNDAINVTALSLIGHMCVHYCQANTNAMVDLLVSRIGARSIWQPELQLAMIQPNDELAPAQKRIWAEKIRKFPLPTITDPLITKRMECFFAPVMTFARDVRTILPP